MSVYVGEAIPGVYTLGVGALGTPVCCSVAAPARGVLAPVFTISTSTGFGGVLLASYAVACGSPNLGAPTHSLLLTGIPAGSTVVVDCARRRITENDGTVVRDASDLLSLSGSGTDWIEVLPGGPEVCVCAVAVNRFVGSAAVAIETQAREG